MILSTESPVKNLVPVLITSDHKTRSWANVFYKRPQPFRQSLRSASLFHQSIERVSFALPPVVLCSDGDYPYIDDVVSATLQACILEPERRGRDVSVAMAAFYLKNQGYHMLVGSCAAFAQARETTLRALFVTDARFPSDDIFVMQPKMYLAELKKKAPDLYLLCEKAFYAGVQKTEAYYPDPAFFAKIPMV